MKVVRFKEEVINPVWCHLVLIRNSELGHDLVRKTSFLRKDGGKGENDVTRK